MKKASVFIMFCVIALVFLAIQTPKLNAYKYYSEGDENDTEARENSGCRQCHGYFPEDIYTSLTDGQNWEMTLMDTHRNLMLSQDCETCHFGETSVGTFYPVKINESFAGQGLPELACMGCHGRDVDAEDPLCDDIPVGEPDEGHAEHVGKGMGLRQHHYNAGVTQCTECHFDADPANCTPVGENVYPPYYFIPDQAHPNKPWDPCNPNEREDFRGDPEGLDNDGDGEYDQNDTDCSSLVPEALCFDSLDNDTDTRIDCEDPDCNGVTGSSCPGGTLICRAGLEQCRQDPQDAHLPKTGQTICYDENGAVISCAGTGQDGEYQAGVTWPGPRFMDNGDGTVLDNLTGLTWTKDANLPGSRMPWKAALAFCNDLNLGAVGDAWRLPNQNELRSLISFGTFDPVLPLGHPFVNVFHGGPPSPSTISPPLPNACEDCGFYWSSTSISLEPNFAWNAGMYGAHTDFHNLKSDPYGVWCTAEGDDPSAYPAAPQVTEQFTCTDTRGNLIDCTGTGQDGEYQMGPPSPSPRYTDNGDETVTDNYTGLEWTKDANMAGGEAMSWEMALDLCNDLSLGAYNDWRLPNMKELRSLLNLEYGFPALTPGHPFTDVQNSIYWCSSTEPNDFTRSILVNMGFGMLDWYWEKYKEFADFGQHNAWCVRAGEGL